MRFITSPLRFLKFKQIPSSKNLSPLSSILTLIMKIFFTIILYLANSKVKYSSAISLFFSVVPNNLMASFVRSSHLFKINSLLFFTKKIPAKIQRKAFQAIHSFKNSLAQLLTDTISYLLI